MKVSNNLEEKEHVEDEKTRSREGADEEDGDQRRVRRKLPETEVHHQHQEQSQPQQQQDVTLQALNDHLLQLRAEFTALRNEQVANHNQVTRMLDGMNARLLQSLARQGQSQESHVESSATPRANRVGTTAAAVSRDDENQVAAATTSTLTNEARGDTNQEATTAATAKGANRVAKLSDRPQTLSDLWEEWHVGIDGNKPAKLFTAKERRKVKSET